MSHRYSDILRKIAPSLAQYSNGGRMLRVLAEFERMADDPETARWDTAEACHHIGTYYHGGQWCPLYVLQCTGFEPGCSWRRPERDSVAASIAACLAPLARARS